MVIKAGYRRDVMISSRVNKDDLDILKQHKINISDLMNSTVHQLAKAYSEVKVQGSKVSEDVANAVRYLDRKNGDGYIGFTIQCAGIVPTHVLSMVNICLRDIFKTNYPVSEIEEELRKMYL